MYKPFLAAAIQMRSGLDQEKNLQQASALIEQAAAKGAKFIATPEMTTLLDRKPRRLFDALADGEDQDIIQAFAMLAKRLQIHLLLGSAPIILSREPRKAANRSFLFGPDGTCLARYDKIHMFDVDLPNGEQWKESSIYQPGEQIVSAKTALAMIGLSICYDLRFAQLYRRLAREDAEILCVPSAFTVPTGKAHWEILLRARAIETGSFVIAPAQGGEHEDGRTTYGHSMIIAPWGDVLAHLDHDQPGFCLAEIDTGLVHETRQQIPSLNYPDMVQKKPNSS